MRRRPTSTGPRARALRLLAYASALAATIACSVAPAVTAAAPTLAPTDRVLADLSDDDHLEVRDRRSLHTAAAMPTFDQYRGNDADVLAACGERSRSCDVRGDGRLGLASDLPATDVGAASTPWWVLLLAAPLVLALALPAWHLSGVRLRPIARATSRAAVPVVATTWVLGMVLGIRRYDAFGGAYLAAYSQNLLLGVAIAVQLAVSVMAIVAVVRRRATLASAVGRVVRPLVQPALLLVLAFVSYAWISAAWAPSATNANETLATMLGGCAAAIALAVVVRGRRDVVRVMLVTASASAVVGGLVGGLVLPAVDLRTAGIPGDPNLLGTTIACGAVIALVGVLHGRSRIERVGSLSLIGVAAIGMAGTQSRTALLAFVAGSIAVALLVRSRRACAFGGLAVVAAVAAVVLVPLAGGDGQGSAIDRTTSAGASTGRLDTWQNGLRQVRANPAIGVGIGGFVPSIERYRTPDDLSFAQTAHNTPLQVAAELGLPGLALGIAAALAMFVPLARRARAGDALATAWCGAAVVLLTASQLLTLYADTLAWLVVAAGVATTVAGTAAAYVVTRGDATGGLADVVPISGRAAQPNGMDDVEDAEAA